MKDAEFSYLRTNQVDPICGMQVNETNAVGKEIYIGVR